MTQAAITNFWHANVKLISSRDPQDLNYGQRVRFEPTIKGIVSGEIPSMQNVPTAILKKWADFLYETGTWPNRAESLCKEIGGDFGAVSEKLLDAAISSGNDIFIAYLIKRQVCYFLHNAEAISKLAQLYHDRASSNGNSYKDSLSGIISHGIVQAQKHIVKKSWNTIAGVARLEPFVEKGLVHNSVLSSTYVPVHNLYNLTGWAFACAVGGTAGVISKVGSGIFCEEFPETVAQLTGINSQQGVHGFGWGLALATGVAASIAFKKSVWDKMVPAMAADSLRRRHFEAARQQRSR